MPGPGSNLPGFRSVQLDFAAHIRDPEANPRPADVAERRMQIYRDLFYNNIENFVASSFPVARKLLNEDEWHSLVRRFVASHPSNSPYFLEISQEFLTFLDGTDRTALPAFLLELCHYEWVELALGVADTALPASGFDPAGDLAGGVVLVSPLAWPLCYQFPVHRIGPGYQPAAPPPAPTYLVVYRDRALRVRFLESNSVTHRLLALLDGHRTGQEALSLLATELPQLNPETIHARGMETLEKLVRSEVLLGIRTD